MSKQIINGQNNPTPKGIAIAAVVGLILGLLYAVSTLGI